MGIVKEELLNECGLWEPSSPEMEQGIRNGALLQFPQRLPPRADSTMRISVSRIDWEVSYNVTWCCASSRPCQSRRWSCGFTYRYEGKGDVHQWRQHSLTRDFHFLHLQMTRPVPLPFLTHGRTVGLRGTYERSLGEVTTLPTYSLPRAAVSTRVLFHGISKACSVERSWRHLRY